MGEEARQVAKTGTLQSEQQPMLPQQLQTHTQQHDLAYELHNTEPWPLQDGKEEEEQQQSTAIVARVCAERYLLTRLKWPAEASAAPRSQREGLP